MPTEAETDKSLPMRLPLILPLAAALALILGFGLPATAPGPADPGQRLAVGKTAPVAEPQEQAASRGVKLAL